MDKDLVVQVRNAQKQEDGRINCEVNHPEHGWIPFTASSNDTEAFGVAVFEKAERVAAAYTPPDPETVKNRGRRRMTVSAFQAMAALENAGLLEQAETLIQGADKMTQLAWAKAQSFHRNSPTITAIAPELGLDDAQLDNLFEQAKQIEA